MAHPDRRMLHGRIGSYGKHVHVVEELALLPDGTYYGVSPCKVWAGEARLTEEPVTCPKCKEKVKS